MKNIVTEPRLIAELLTRGVDEIIDRDHLKKRLKSGDCLRVKLGIDPTSPNIHLGRSIPLLKLRDFQNLGHKIVLIIGDFTGTIGDTSDKDSERPMLSEAVIKDNLKTYIKQAAKIINIDEAEIHYNSKWLGELKYKEISNQANDFSLNEFISRDNIRRRLETGKRISLREVLYPLMQGYDSVEVKADVEIGGVDQRFNLLAGRHLQKTAGQDPQDLLTNPLIEGLDGRKMSSSFGNTVNLFDAPNEMFGKIMSLKDEFIIKYFTLLTRIESEVIAKYEKELKAGANPRDYKLILAGELVKMYHSAKEAEVAHEFFINTFSKKEIPSEEIAEFLPQDYTLGAVLLESALASSKSEIRRLLEQGGIKVDGQTVSDINLELKAGSILQRGKIKFVKIA
ncbi:MAG: tyrosine--tRNA ligase [Patescibacteria group bacterium]|jgi:tyrosyl-tRNA synthetase|nr:tyrosine--tRNA ligase [Patescibacteria group bacterium]